MSVPDDAEQVRVAAVSQRLTMRWAGRSSGRGTELRLRGCTELCTPQGLLAEADDFFARVEALQLCFARTATVRGAGGDEQGGIGYQTIVNLS